ncbi:MAG TPA: DUF1573 domain-containing protein, partial [Acidobacteriota bacterium]|nr:DUF1573 domain-containing protein [Acidobacteriota bacterium]
MRHRTPRRAGAVITAAAVFLAAAAWAQSPKPRAVFRETTHDFGKVKQGDVVTHEFVFRNEGQAPLLVEKVETTCGCTAALVSEKKIGPGKEGKIKTSFDTRGYSGRLSRYIYLISNDGENTRRELSLVADIQVPPAARIDVDRYNVDMGLVLEGESPSARVVIKSSGERELKVDVAHESVQFFSGGKPLITPFFLPTGESREIEMRFPPQEKTGVMRDYVLVKSNDPVRGTMSIYVSRYVVSKKELKDLFERYKTVLKDN